MKPNNAGKDTKEKLKQNVQTQDAGGMQAISVLYMTQLEAISKQCYGS